MDVKEVFKIPPSTNIINVLGSTGYSLETAMADILDNSIAANAENISIRFSINHSENDAVEIIDDGTGMSLETMKQAAIIANISQYDDREDQDLGRFSMGLKSASMSFCNRLYIISKEKGKTMNAVCLDFEEISKSQNWNAYVVDLPEYKDRINESGTVIVWKKLKFTDRSLTNTEMNRKIASLETHLSHVFSDFLLNGRVRISLNGYQIPGWDPFARGISGTKKIDCDAIQYYGKKIGVQIYILPVLSRLTDAEKSLVTGYGMIEQQGFYVYRNRRLITEGGWLNLHDLQVNSKYDYARIRIDLPNTLDEEFKVNFMKSSIVIPDLLREQFKVIARQARKESVNSAVYTKDPARRRLKRPNDLVPVWYVKHTDNAIVLSVNEEHPILNRLTKDMPEKDRKKLFSLMAKTLPVASIQNNTLLEKEYSRDEMMILIRETIEEMKQSGVEQQEIITKLSITEPFCRENYREYLMEYILEDEDEQ